MKKLLLVLTLLVVIALPTFASVKTYQVTGPVLSVTADSIVVQKGNDKWEIARDASTKVTGDLKVGAKVMIEYRMTATSVHVSEAKAAAKPAAKKK